MIPREFIQELLTRVDVVEVVGRSVELKRSGATWKGLCPFHGEKTPSFTVSAQRQTYHCFGCAEHGNAIGFLMALHGMGFVDAVQDLARQAGLAVPEDTSTAAEREQARQRQERQATLAETLARAAEHYRAQLKASDRAIAYLKGRGLDGRVAARFGLGYAPDGWRGLAGAFARYDDPLLEESGLVVVRGDDAEDAAAQTRYDRFRDRIMFPIRSVQGEVIGFGGRVLDAGEPKYLNSPETPLFSKGRELYGLFEARQAIRQRGHVLVVEGYMDVVALAQNGFAQAVATLGTACTADHVQKLVRFVDQVVFAFDGDAAGRRAAVRALEASLPHADDSRVFRFLFLPAEHDPDSFVRAHGAAAFEAAIEGAVPLSRHLLAVAGEDADLATAEGRARFLAAARPLWNALPAAMLKRQLLAELAGKAALPVDELAAAWRAGAARSRSPPASTAAGPRPSARAALAGPVARQRLADRLLDDLVRQLFVESSWWDSLAADDHGVLCGLASWHGQAFRFLDRVHAEHGRLPWAALRERVVDEPWGEAALAVVDAVDPGIEPSFDDVRAAVEKLRAAPARREAERVLQRG